MSDSVGQAVASARGGLLPSKFCSESVKPISLLPGSCSYLSGCVLLMFSASNRRRMAPVLPTG
jgi:hypothetical protein